ncbi:hypothetical protein [Candidatus Regiella endosymbiont of Tuberolachnus salignus]|uniref:hypothetical protein n=1 Tax=Candidatus Regiella endosymbiont of Tuberolachnus salignus TaxID=3077956 RepID=UPI0030D42A2B
MPNTLNYESKLSSRGLTQVRHDPNFAGDSSVKTPLTHIDSAIVKSAMDKNPTELEAAKANLSAALTELMSLNAADTPEEKMMGTAISVSNAAMQTLMSLPSLFHLIDLLINEVARKLMLNHERSTLTVAVSMAIMEQLKQNELDKGETALAGAILAAVTAVVLTATTTALQVKAVKQTNLANKQKELAKNTRDLEKDLRNKAEKATGKDKETLFLASKNAGLESEGHERAMNKSIAQADRFRMTAQAIGNLIPAFTGLINGITQYRMSHIDASSTELRTFEALIRQIEEKYGQRMTELWNEIKKMIDEKSNAAGQQITTTRGI